MCIRDRIRAQYGLGGCFNKSPACTCTHACEEGAWAAVVALHVFGHRITSPVGQRAQGYTVVEQRCEADLREVKQYMLAGISVQYSRNSYPCYVLRLL